MCEIPVSMDRYDAIDFLKMYLGTLFLDNYVMPKLEAVKIVLAAAARPLNKFEPLGVAGIKLRQLCKKVLKHSGDLLYFSENRKNFGRFSDQLYLYAEEVAPVDREGSALIFFEKFFNDDYTPQSEVELEFIIEWLLFVVEFDEANEERTKKALDLLNDLYEYLCEFEPSASSSPQSNDEHDKDDDEGYGGDDETVCCDCAAAEAKRSIETNMDEVTKQDKQMSLEKCAEYYHVSDTKHCDCYEYEMSGDCYHVDNV